MPIPPPPSTSKKRAAGSVADVCQEILNIAKDNAEHSKKMAEELEIDKQNADSMTKMSEAVLKMANLFGEKKKIVFVVNCFYFNNFLINKYIIMS